MTPLLKLFVLKHFVSPRALAATEVSLAVASMALAFTSVAAERATGTTVPGLRGVVQRPVVPSGQGAPLPSAAGSVAFGLSAGAAVAVLSRRGGGRRNGGRAMRVATMDAPTTTVAKKDLSGKLPDCPRTIWKADNIDIDNIPQPRETAPLIVDAKDLAERLASGTEEEYFVAEREKIMEQLQLHGAILFKNFQTMKDAEGFRAFYDALQLNPCLDPIHTSGLRDMIGKKDAVYEAVNKPSLAQHFVGLHNESTFVKTAMFGAFGCFKPAFEGGGEFLVADGAKIIGDLDKDVLRRIYEKKIRISVSNLDLNFIGALPFGQEAVKESLQDLILKVVAPKFEMDLEMVYGADQSNPWRLQDIEHAQSPINTHPVTGQPVWFCNLHNHSRYLRDRRPCTIPEVGMTDVYHGDLGQIAPEDVEHINKVCERNMVPIMMETGDVILLDNYRVLHGRKVFKGERKHVVTWFESCGADLAREATGDKPDDFMNNLINKTLV
mmetsp:Transcript_112173/g.356467  ORF Transcript_112173/g.356467 Transcript_112173/m.356467 type:complete len:495 (+) Transcript_112173:100-1584(+)